jgi:multidrug efflux system membrane fusion protein
MKPIPYFNRHPWLIALLIAVAITVWMASGLDHDRQAPGPLAAKPVDRQEEVRVTVRTQQAERVERYVSVNGRTAPSRQVTLAAETTGRVQRILARRGDFVTSGDILLEFDMRDRDVRIAQAQAVLEQRELEFEARQSLLKEGYVSGTQIAESRAQLETARTELRRAQLDMDARQLRAPFDGAIQDRRVEVGDYVQAGDPLLDFVDEGTLVVTASISESDGRFLGNLDRGTARLITGQVVEGKVRYLAPVADVSTRTFRVEVELDNRDRKIPPGVTAELTLPVGQVLAHRISPALLTLDDAGQVGVKIIESGNIVRFVPADIARSESDAIWLAGLPEMTTFITVGQGFVRDGQQVIPVEETGLAAKLASE